MPLPPFDRGLSLDNPDTYAKVIADLREVYDRHAAQRDSWAKESWKIEERESFLARLRREGKERLLELGAGTGQDSLFFLQQGLKVVATDLSPEMVRRCRDKGLDAHVMDFLNLRFPPCSFDAAYALNCLLHVPNTTLPDVLEQIHRILEPDALLYIGTYGGEDREGVMTEDSHRPPRYFSFRSDATLLAMVGTHFDLVDFRVIENDGLRFQATTVRRRETGPMRTSS